jgi:hypothetical protein
MANGNVFDISRGVKTGLDFAMQQQRINLQGEQLDLQKKRVAQSAADAQIAMTGKVIDQLEKIQKLPAKTGKNMLASLEKQIQPLGFNLSEEMKAGMFDPEMSQVYLNAYSRFKKSLTTGNTAQAAIEAKQLQDILGGPEALELINRAGSEVAAQERAATTAEGRFKTAMLSQVGQTLRTEEKIASVEKIEGRKAVAKEKAAKLKSIDDLRKQVLPIQKELSSQEQAVDDVLAIAKKDPTFSNPQNQIKLVRRAQALSEARNSVVREEEFRVTAKAAGIPERAFTFLKSFKTGDVIPSGVAKDIVKMVELSKTVFEKTKRKRLSPIVEEIKASGFQDEAGRILGADKGILSPEAQKPTRNQLTSGQQRALRRARELKKSPLTQNEINNILRIPGLR